jgi:GNAT superfamily N-acetyltransferase
MYFEIKEFEKFPEQEFKSLKDETLSFHPFLQWEENLDHNARMKLGALKERRKGDYMLRLGIEHDGKLVAASFSFQMSTTDLMMGVSMVRPEFRGQGIYTSLCKRTLEIAKREGFQSVISNHMLTNNAILIAKLKLGFKICGLETHAVHGTLLKMVYHLNEQMAEALKYRAGEIFLFNEEQIHENFGTP